MTSHEPVIAWRAERSLAFQGEARAIAGVAPLSARVAAYYASFHASHVALLQDERFDDPEALAAIDPALCPMHQTPKKHTGKPDRYNNVGLSWVLSRMHERISGLHQFLRQASESCRYQDIDEGSLFTVDACLEKADCVIREAGVIELSEPQSAYDKH